MDPAIVFADHRCCRSVRIRISAPFHEASLCQVWARWRVFLIPLPPSQQTSTEPLRERVRPTAKAGPRRRRLRSTLSTHVLQTAHTRDEMTTFHSTFPLAASRSQEPFGSHAPSIRAGAHGTEHLRLHCMKPGRGSLLLQVGSRENPGAKTETRTSVDVRAARAPGRTSMSQAAWPFTIAPSGMSPCST